MGMRRLMVLAAALSMVLSAAPSQAASIRLAGPTSGSWTFTDFSPDPTTTPEAAEQHCSTGQVPATPNDVNAQKVKIKKAGTLELTSHNQLDWAMEIQDAKGNNITGTDGGDVNTAESLSIYLGPGTYQVVYCNMEGEPEISVDWAFKR